MKFKLFLLAILISAFSFGQKASGPKPIFIFKSKNDSISTHYSINLYNSMGNILDNIEVDVYDNFEYFPPFEKCNIPGFYFIVGYSKYKVIKQTFLQ